MSTMLPLNPVNQVAANTEPLAKLVGESDVFGFNLLTLSLDRFGNECLSWDPATIQLEYQETLHAALEPENVERLLAAIVVLTSDRFLRDADFFCRACNLFSFATTPEDLFIPPDVASIAWGVCEANLIEPMDHATQFSDDIRILVRETIKDGGLVHVPNELKFIVEDDDLTAGGMEELADDPELATAIWKSQDSQHQDIEGFVRHQLNNLFAQLKRLPLHNADVQPATRLHERMSHDRTGSQQF